MAVAASVEMPVAFEMVLLEFDKVYAPDRLDPCVATAPMRQLVPVYHGGELG